MLCRMGDLRYKDVINIHDGRRLGCVCDLDIDTANACIISIVIYGRLRFFGLFGREDDITIKWCSIKNIGDDIILVDCDLGTTGSGGSGGSPFSSRRQNNCRR